MGSSGTEPDAGLDADLQEGEGLALAANYQGSEGVTREEPPEEVFRDTPTFVEEYATSQEYRPPERLDYSQEFADPNMGLHALSLAVIYVAVRLLDRSKPSGKRN